DRHRRAGAIDRYGFRTDRVGRRHADAGRIETRLRKESRVWSLGSRVRLDCLSWFFTDDFRPKTPDPRLLNLNYFNYFTEIEDAFVRRRGKHLHLSPLDWALIESWKETGIPLHVALRAIEKSFDSWE